MACALPGARSEFSPRAAGLWHREARLAVPDPASRPWGEGWARVHIEEADLAFGRPGAGVIAVRVTCSTPQRSLEELSRDHWLGIPRLHWRRSRTTLAGWPAIESRAEIDDVDARLLVARVEGCALDLARVAPRRAASDPVFERFLDELALPEPPTAAIDSGEGEGGP